MEYFGIQEGLTVGVSVSCHQCKGWWGGSGSEDIGTPPCAHKDSHRGVADFVQFQKKPICLSRDLHPNFLNLDLEGGKLGLVLPALFLLTDLPREPDLLWQQPKVARNLQRNEVLLFRSLQARHFPPKQLSEKAVGALAVLPVPMHSSFPKAALVLSAPAWLGESSVTATFSGLSWPREIFWGLFLDLSENCFPLVSFFFFQTLHFAC